jgi:ferredoxin--NADP+ reductase
MIGPPGENGKPLLRAYSIASPSWDDELEFYSIKVPGRAADLEAPARQPGRPDHPAPKPVGRWCMTRCCRAGGCGCSPRGRALRPFASLLRDPETWEKYDEVVSPTPAARWPSWPTGREIVEALEATS